MPQKIRLLKSKLQKAGFILLKKRGKGSHTMWLHPLLTNPIQWWFLERMAMMPIAIKNVK